MTAEFGAAVKRWRDRVALTVAGADLRIVAYPAEPAPRTPTGWPCSPWWEPSHS
jgi:hypothetical protein